MQAMCRFFRPNRTAIQPTGAVMIAAAITYEVSTQVISSALVESVPCIYGSDTLAIEASSDCIRLPIMTQRVISVRWGTLCAVPDIGPQVRFGAG